MKAISAHMKEKEEKIQLLMECLAEETAKGIPIVVEGKRDVEALRTMGISGRIIPAKTGRKTFMEVLRELEECETHEVILLLDFDRKGREWTRRLERHLEGSGIKPNLYFWNGLLELVWTDVKDVEGLPAYLKNLRAKLGKT